MEHWKDDWRRILPLKIDTRVQRCLRRVTNSDLIPGLSKIVRVLEHEEWDSGYREDGGDDEMSPSNTLEWRRWTSFLGVEENVKEIENVKDEYWGEDYRSVTWSDVGGAGRWVVQRSLSHETGILVEGFRGNHTRIITRKGKNYPPFMGVQETHSDTT